jgi:diguanylate cyclase (GGDEF)-like protein/PAS domain S-box-containing protein
MVALTALWSISNHSLSQQDAQMHERVNALTSRMAVLLAAGEGHQNTAHVESHLALLMSDQAISCAETVSATGVTLVATPSGIGCNSFDKTQTRLIDIADGAGHKLRVGFSNVEIVKLQTKQFNYAIYILALAVLLATFASWFCFHVIVGRPLSKILSAIRMSQMTGQLTKIEHPTKDELGTLASSFNELHDELDAEAKRNQTALARIDHIYNETPAMMFAINELGNIMSTSDYWLESTGYARRDVLDKNISLFVAKESLEVLHQNVSFATLAQMIQDVPLRFRRKDNNFMDVMLSATRDDHDGLKSYLCVMNDVSEFKQAQRRLQRIAMTDHLTRLPNRKGLFDYVAQLNNQLEELREQTAFLFIDLDGFKAVNDTYGHEAGDELLKLVATRITHHVKSHDFAARLSGDEFVIILQKVKSKSDVPTIATRLLEALALPFDIKNHNLKIGASIGVADFSHGAQTAEEVLRMADKAMYASKNHGKNQITVYQPELAFVDQQDMRLH